MNLNRNAVTSVFIALALLLASFPLSAQTRVSTRARRVQIVVLGTTDLHGNIYPVDYYTNKPDNRGLAKVATLIKRVRKETPNVVLIDSGDTIQGTPLAVLSQQKKQPAARSDDAVDERVELRRDGGR